MRRSSQGLARPGGAVDLDPSDLEWEVYRDRIGQWLLEDGLTIKGVQEQLVLSGLRVRSAALRTKLQHWGLMDDPRVTMAVGASIQDWDGWKNAIRAWYLDYGLSSQQMAQLLAEKDFYVTERMLDNMLTQWDFDGILRTEINQRQAAQRRWQDHCRRLGLRLAPSRRPLPSAVRPVINNQESASFSPNCPFSIRPMNDQGSLFLIRERDKYKEYPNIFAKIVAPANDSSTVFDVSRARLIVLCDTGCGTNVRLRDYLNNDNPPEDWNIGIFLEATINPKNRLPYLIITSHCHYDHILGIKNLDLTRSIVLSSAYDKSYLTPRSRLAKHSLCDELGITVPEYEVGIWADDLQDVIVDRRLPRSTQPIYTGITILQTPGHTPDSLTWYDNTFSPPHIFVGDSLYERQSEDTKRAKWGRESPMPTIFTSGSNLADWSSSMDKMIAFVKERNKELKLTTSEAEDPDWMLVSQSPGQAYKNMNVMLSAAHVTVSVDAEECLFDMREFMSRILRDEVPHRLVEHKNDSDIWLWDDTLDADATHKFETWQEAAKFGRFSVRAPLSLIEKERNRLNSL